MIWPIPVSPPPRWAQPASSLKATPISVSTWGCDCTVGPLPRTSPLALSLRLLFSQEGLTLKQEEVYISEGPTMVCKLAKTRCLPSPNTREKTQESE